MNKQHRLDELSARILKCSKCLLRPTCKNVVPGEGPAEAEIMFVGEGPGQKEDELGRPFVGAAGKLLDEMLADINVKRENVYIANVVKCRPPGNRDPFPEEIKSCWSWLLEQIKIIDPELIVTLGRHSLELFLPGQKISQIHGKVLRREFPDLGKKIFYALYHPAAALYSSGMRSVLITDFKKIPKVLETAKNNKKEKIIESSDVEPEKNKQESLF